MYASEIHCPLGDRNISWEYMITNVHIVILDLLLTDTVVFYIVNVQNLAHGTSRFDTFRPCHYSHGSRTRTQKLLTKLYKCTHWHPKTPLTQESYAVANSLVYKRFAGMYWRPLPVWRNFAQLWWKTNQICIDIICATKLVCYMAVKKIIASCSPFY